MENKENSLFEKKGFIEVFYKFISLLEKTGLLYSNYCIESEEYYGKIISEIIYDIFLSLPEQLFSENDFIKTFIKENKENKLTIFYLIDILKEKIKNNEKEMIEIKKYIPDIDNLIYVHNNIFSAKKNEKKSKLFLKRKIYQIEGVNFSIYYFAKSFIFLDKMKKSEKMKYFLLLLSQDIYRLYNKGNNFYSNKAGLGLLLYSKTKSFFESYTKKDPNIFFNNYETYFNNDIKKNSKDDITLCYSSRLLTDKIVLDKNKRKEIITKMISFSFQNNKTDDYDEDLLKDLGNITKSEIKNINTNELYNGKINQYYNPFDITSKKKSINNPKNYFLKITFAEIYKDLMFNDSTFEKIKLSYFSKFREHKELCKDSKQMNYPIKQKNYCNSVEPKIFMKRDYNFYDERILEISHSYLNFDILKQNIKNIYFYPHINKKKDTKFLECELVTAEYVIFGKIYFFENFTYFESEQDPRDKQNIQSDSLVKYLISNRSKENKSCKYKAVLIFNEDIKEIIQRRTLLVNQSIEIFQKNGKSHFFNFFRIDNVIKAYGYFKEINKNFIFKFDTNNNKEDISILTENFRKGDISNYKYILYLNKYSTRTYNDLSQYPVFPWLIKEYDKLQELLTLLDNKDTNTNNVKDYFRDMRYAISLQTEEKRKKAKYKFDTIEEEEFPKHLYLHYSTQGYIFFYLMRNNPYLINIIKLQNYNLENPHRLFNSFQDMDRTTTTSNDNREIIPDFFCYFDCFLNLNCSFFGYLNDINLVDDFDLRDNSFINNKNKTNKLSSFANALLSHVKLLNNTYVSTILSQWVDIIFGKNQLPEKKEDYSNSYNIYEQFVYEKFINLQNEIDKYYELYKELKINKKEYMKNISDLESIVTMRTNFGMNPIQIKETITYEGKNKSSFDYINKGRKLIDEKIIYFKKVLNDNYLIIKEKENIKGTNNNNNKIAVIYDNNFREKKGNIYDCRGIISLKNQGRKNLSNLNYAFSCLYLKNKKSLFVLLTCQYLGNYFRIQYNDKIINIFYEDFVTCIKGNYYKDRDNIFYTGLLNGKLTEWEIKFDNYLNPKIKEKKHVYAHKSSITAIEIYSRQKIILTAGEDKFLYIRKIFDFELLTVINLTYCFENPIVSEACNILPTLIKVSDLNLLYVLIYDKDKENSFIRGYNLNGLFFAQSEPSNYLNISFTKSSNLIVGQYDSKEIHIISASNLTLLWKKVFEDELGINKMVEYNHKECAFYRLLDDKMVSVTLKDRNESKKFDSF